jgi:hypothetical protein
MRSAFRRYRHSAAVTDLRRVTGRGHSLTIDGGWHEFAGIVLDWLQAGARRQADASADDRDRPDRPLRESGGWRLYLPDPGDRRSGSP